MEDSPLLPDWLKIGLTICGGLGAWTLTLWFAKKWFDTAVLDQIKQLTEDIKSIRTTVDGVQGNAVTFMTNTSRVVNESARTHMELFKRFMIETKKIVYDETTKMSAVLDGAVKQASEALAKSSVADEATKDLRIITEKNSVQVGKLIDVCNGVNEQNKAIKSQVVQISTDLKIIKERK